MRWQCRRLLSSFSYIFPTDVDTGWAQSEAPLEASHHALQTEKGKAMGRTDRKKEDGGEKKEEGEI